MNVCMLICVCNKPEMTGVTCMRFVEAGTCDCAIQVCMYVFVVEVVGVGGGGGGGL